MRRLTDRYRAGAARPPSRGRAGRRLVAAATWPARALAALAAPLLVALILLTCLDVGLRNTGFDPVRGAIEYTEVMLVLLVYLGIAEAERTDSHVAMSLVSDRLAAPVRQLVLLVGGGLLVGFLAVLAWSTGEVALRSVAEQEVRFGNARVPVWPARALIPIALVAMAGQTLIRMGRQGRALADWHRDRRGTAGPARAGRVPDVS